MDLAVGLILKEVPVQGILVMPLVPLAQLRPHEGQFLARMGEHIGVEGTDTGELLTVLPGHFPQEGTLHVDDLVMGQGQDVVFREGVHQGEGDVPVVELAEIGIQLDVVADVVHPAHVPFIIKSKATNIWCFCNAIKIT